MDRDNLEYKLDQFLELAGDAAELIKELMENGELDIISHIEGIKDILGDNFNTNQINTNIEHLPCDIDVIEQTEDRFCNKHDCKSKCYCAEFDIPANACVIKTTVAQNGVTQCCVANMCMVTACYTIYVKYRTCEGTEHTISKSGCVIFSCVPRWAENDYTVHMPSCPQVTTCGCKVSVKGIAKICY